MVRLRIALLAFLALVIASGCSSTSATRTTLDPATPEPVDATNAVRIDDWYQDPPSGETVGTASKQAYGLLEGRTPRRRVVVAVIDSGVDIRHEDIDGNLWTNVGEIPANGIDDDGNGYVDDIHGWNFIGGPDGQNVAYDTYEVARELKRLDVEFRSLSDSDVAEGKREAFAYYLEVKSAYYREKERMTDIGNSIESAVNALTFANSVMARELGTSRFSIDDVVSVSSEEADVKQAQGILVYLDQIGVTQEDLLHEREEVSNRLKYGLDLDYDPRATVGDNYSDVREQYYGNADVVGTDPSHGTHVAGIIAAERANGIGIDGLANNTVIMVVRAVPNGDERDKDVANAIRYAVDNGADIINMSFGKSFSSDPDVVAEAVAYADDKGVLLVHASGNDAENNDSVAHFPNRKALQGRSGPSSWLEVGASGRETRQLAAAFSNYGSNDVDIFAPGVEIVSTMPGNVYEAQDGTSMAAPVVSGIAAMLLAYFPDLSSVDLKHLIMSTAQTYGQYMVTKPGSEESVPFGSLSVSGGVVNAANAVQQLLK